MYVRVCVCWPDEEKRETVIKVLRIFIARFSTTFRALNRGLLFVCEKEDEVEEEEEEAKFTRSVHIHAFDK